MFRLLRALELFFHSRETIRRGNQTSTAHSTTPDLKEKVSPHWVGDGGGRGGLWGRVSPSGCPRKGFLSQCSLVKLRGASGTEFLCWSQHLLPTLPFISMWRISGSQIILSIPLTPTQSLCTQIQEARRQTYNADTLVRVKVITLFILYLYL